MITFDDITVAFGDTVVLPQLDLTVNEGEFFTLLGPSGCGKTTALRTLAGFNQPASGRILIDGQDVTRLPPDKRRIGMVFQNYALFPTQSVFENIAFGLRVRREKRQVIDAAVREAGDAVGLDDRLLRRQVGELSGGQQQRVAIARALVMQPRILLLDEPLSNLDAKLRSQLRVQLKRLQREVGITTLYVTHDQDEALALSDRLAVFDSGRISQVGTPREVYERSATEFVCTFLGDSTRLGPELVTALGLTHADTSGTPAAYLRLERPVLDPGPSDGLRVFDGVVRLVSFQGLFSRIEVRVLDTDLLLVVTTSRGLVPSEGDHVRVGIDPAAVLTYPAAAAPAAAPDSAATPSALAAAR